MTPVVFLHGMLGAPSSFDEVCRRLPSTFEVLAPFVPGHGPGREPLPASFDDAVRAIAAKTPPRSLVVGYSLGGRLALALSAVMPLGGLVLIGAHAGLDEPERAARIAWDDELSRIANAADLGELVARWERLPAFATQSDSDRASQRATRLSHDPTRIAWALSALGQGRMPDLRATLSALRIPTRYLIGALDARLVDASSRVAMPPAVDVYLVPDRGHNLILEAPDAVAEQIASIHQELS